VTGDQAGQVGRIPPSSFRQLGPINWVITKLAARQVRAPEMHLFTTLGNRRLLFWAWAVYGGRLLSGRLPRVDTELVILRVAHLRACEYELQHHRSMARRHGLDARLQAAIFAWPEIPEAGGKLSARQQTLLQATDEFITDRTITSGTWRRLEGYLDRRRLIEFCLLAGQYDGLAATISALDIPLDNPRQSLEEDIGQHGQRQ
jgi:AhpD family alkylhydroperoxidase